MNMKKITALLLIAALALALCGCGELANLKNVELPPLPDASDAQTPEETATPTPAQEIDTTGSKAASDLPEHVIVSISSQKEEHYDPQNGDTLILTFSYETPAVYIEGRDDAAAAINEYIATVDETYYTGNDYGVSGEDGLPSGVNGMLEMATDNYSYAVENGQTDLPLEYVSSRTAKVARIDSRVLSMVYNTYTFTSGAHGNYFDTGYTFDTESGEYVTLDMLSSDREALAAFLADYMMKLYKADKDGYYSARVVEDIALTTQPDVETAIAALVRDGSWYFDEDGMVIFSTVYELGPYAAGIVEFDIPYSDLNGHIDDKWLPADVTSDGSLELKAQSDVADGSIEIIDKVTVDENSEQLCLEAVGTVYDVRLSAVDYSDRFYETAQLWACSYMSDCVLQLETLIPDGMPKLRVSYMDASGQQKGLLLTQSGEDGSYILIDDDSIEAVG